MYSWSSIKDFLLQRKVLFIVYIIISLVTTVQMIALSRNATVWPGNVTTAAGAEPVFSHYNNYIIFKQSWFHLLQGKDLYVLYLDEYWDLYKYSPTFSVLMAPLAYMPDWLGLSVWTLINSLGLFVGIYMLPYTKRVKGIILWLILVELLTSLQNSQSNALLAALMIAAYACMENRKMLWASLWLVLATLIKVYGAVGFILFLLYPGKIKAAIYTIVWALLLGALPLLVTSFPTLVAQYQSWGRMMAEDQSASYGLSVMGWLHSWFGLDGIKSYVTLAGIIGFFVPFARWRMYGNEVYRILLLTFILVWVIIFNHKAESPTFIIAVAGMGIWFFARTPSPWRLFLLWFVIVGTSLSVTDLFPPVLKQSLLVPYVIKALPCIILWFTMLLELLRLKSTAVLPATWRQK